MTEEEPKVYKWIEKFEKLEIPSEPQPSPVTYGLKLVAFIDILGITDMVINNILSPQELITILGGIRNYVESTCNQLASEGKLDYLQIGDGFVIVTNLRLINRICQILSKIQWRTLIYSGQLIRGALTAGEATVSQDGRIFIGPAIIEAYKLERENAIYPRILYLNDIENHVSGKLIKFKYIEEDQDKIKYIDFIKYHFDIDRHTKKSLDQLLTTHGIKQKIKDEYNAKFANGKSEYKAIAQKYGWLISKFKLLGVDII